MRAITVAELEPPTSLTAILHHAFLSLSARVRRVVFHQYPRSKHPARWLDAAIYRRGQRATREGYVYISLRRL